MVPSNRGIAIGYLDSEVQPIQKIEGEQYKHGINLGVPSNAKRHPRFPLDGAFTRIWIRS